MSTIHSLYLYLEDGTCFPGQSFGFFGESAGEVVFSTGMTGYPESLTDPSYRGQILVATYPLIGNYGVPNEQEQKNGLKTHLESDTIQAQAIIVSEYCANPSHWNMDTTLDKWLKKHRVPGIYGIDTRALTKKLREKGVMLGKILTQKPKQLGKFWDPNLTNLVAEVSTKKLVIYKPEKKSKKTVILYDFGIKYNIIRNFLKRGITVIRVPWDYDLTTSKLKYDGVFYSPGPGDPKMIAKTVITNITFCLKNTIPTFGICLGHQLMALAIGADTYKMKYGHRSLNQPCLDLSNQHCYITSQNHGFAVNKKTLPREWEEWITNANDNTCEGMRHRSGRFFSVQFHPEASPGPMDTEFLFDEFIKII
jgi:carbamoyl-phosphate synthase small subunit